jgi:hypothetical protein
LAFNHFHVRRQAALTDQRYLGLYIHADDYQPLWVVRKPRHKPRIIPGNWPPLRLVAFRHHQGAETLHPLQWHCAPECPSSVGSLPGINNVWKFTSHSFTIPTAEKIQPPDLNGLFYYKNASAVTQKIFNPRIIKPLSENVAGTTGSRIRNFLT